MWKATPGALIVIVALMLAGAGQASAQGRARQLRRSRSSRWLQSLVPDAHGFR